MAVKGIRGTPALPGINFFGNSPQDGQSNIWRGGRRVPETPSGGVSPDEYVVDAAGNGDFTTIAEAITALGASSGTIRVLAGTYLITTVLTLAANQSIIGSGYGTNITTTSNITCINLDGNRSAIYMCRIDGNSTGTSQNGISIEGEDSIAKDCWITQMGNDGIIVENDADKVVIEGCKVEDCVDILVNIKAANFGILSNNYLDNSTGDDCIQMVGGDSWTISGNKIQNSGVHGLQMLNADFSTITGNYIFSNGDNNTNGDGISITDCQKTVIVGNYINGNDGVGVRLTKTIICDRNLIVGNIIYGNEDGEIVDNGDNTLAANNIIA